MNDESTEEMDARLTRALERVPVVAVADDFALRVMQRVPEGRVRLRVASSAAGSAGAASRTGRRFGLAALVVLAGLMFGLVPLAGGTSHHAIAAVEWILCAECVGVTLWLSPASRLFER